LITYNNLYMDMRQRLIKEGVMSASLEAREMVCYASGKTKEQLMRDAAIYAPNSVVAQVAELMQRRLAGEPLAYIIGQWDFYGMTLDITPDVLIPRPDTEVLVDHAIKAAKNMEGDLRILDICCGSGCIGLALANSFPEARVVLGDCSESALKVARQNIRKTDMTSLVSCVTLDALKPAPISIGAFNIVVCNPPYIPSADIAELDKSVREHEPIMALDGGENGMKFFSAVSSLWRHAIRQGGILLFECGIGQADRVCDILTREGYGNIEVHRDLAGVERVVMGTPL